MTRNAVVIIYDKKQIRSLVEPDTFRYFRENSDLNVSLLCFRGLADDLIDSPYPITFIPDFPIFLRRSGSLLASALLWQKRMSSTAHLRRANLTFGKKKIREVSSYQARISNEAIGEFQRFIVRLVSLRLFYNFLSKIRNYFVNKFLAKIFYKLGINFENISCVFVPCTGVLTGLFDDYINFFNRIKIVTIGIQDNWDNLSSKSFIDSSPKLFCVWGEQSKGHLLSIHSLYKSEIIVMGSPRMTPYFSTEPEYEKYQKIPSQLRSKVINPYVFFAGTGEGVDDLFILDNILKMIKNKSLSLIYRPHPNTREPLTQKNLIDYTQKGVIIDNSSESKQVFYHCGVLMNCELLITQYSTTLLEALLCNKKVLLPGFLQRSVTYDYTDAVNTWAHFIGLPAFPNVFRSNTQNTFNEDFIQALESPSLDSSLCADWMCAPIDSRVILKEIMHSKF